MESCIICGADAGGPICRSHEEDVVFEFVGDQPDQLTTGRYYRGEVDGFADFGVFVDVGGVTGLLHESELDRRLESLDWDPGETVYVQVTEVKNNGDIDLGWSIRQAPGEFRGTLVDAPSGDRLPEDETGEDATTDGAGGGDATTDEGGGDDRSQGEQSRGADPSPEPDDDGDNPAATNDGGRTVAIEAPTGTEAAIPRVRTDEMADHVGDAVRLEGEVLGVRQTSGPTVFELSDEAGTAECAAFEAAGVRAYPDVEVGDVVRLEGEVERRHGSVQLETEALLVLEGDQSVVVEERLEAAIDAKARPATFEPLADHDAVAALEEDLVETATRIRRAVIEGRPVVVRHTQTADGYVAGAAIERAVLPLVRDEHAREDAQYHFFDRRPLPNGGYDMEAATGDLTDMLQARERHDEQLPLIVLVDAGGTVASVEGFELLSVYDVDTIVLEDGPVAGTVRETVDAAVAGTAEDLTTTVLAATVAAHVNPAAREAVAHLPGVSYWEDTPEAYRELAERHGLDAATAAHLREAVALEAYYQSFNDKRELVEDVLFDPDRELAGHVSEQFREKLDDEIATASHNLTRQEARGVAVAVLDTEAYTHRFDFPPTGLLLSELHRREREDAGRPFVTIGLDEDELHFRATAALDVAAVGERVADAEPAAGLRTVGGADGHLEFLVGEREAVLEASLEAIAELL